MSKATGHDKISAAILKKLCDELAIPFTLVVRRLFYDHSHNRAAFNSISCCRLASRGVTERGGLYKRTPPKRKKKDVEGRRGMRGRGSL